MSAAPPPAAAGNAATDGTLQADAFKRLYPQQYFDKFIEQSVRPDGRPLGRARATSIGLGVVTTADASALVKLGSTTALAGVKCEVMATSQDAPDQGALAVQVELPPMCSATTRPGRPSEAAQVLSEQLGELLLTTPGMVDLRQLSINPGRAAWQVYLDIYVLDADGALHDACLLAALAALSTLQLQAVSVDESGRIQTGEAAAAEAAAAAGQAAPAAPERRRFALGCRPVSLTCAIYQDRLLVDPTAEEEGLAGSTVTVTVDEAGQLLSLVKPGGVGTAGTQRMSECIEAARLRSKEVLGLLDQALAQHAAAGAGGS